ncbi:MAG: hypothetical protein KKA84_02730 [Bacteroidetes bacterium]|nr:hypothetical protein [Bacteroidota bacterium]
MKQFTLYLTIALFLSTEIISQSLSASLMLGSPRGEFEQAHPNKGYGLQVQAMLKNPDRYSPIGIGIDAGFLFYSATTEYRPFSNTIPDIGVEVERMNSMANAHLVFQISPMMGMVRPYLEGYGGFAYYFTKTDVSSDYNDEVIFSDITYDDFAFSYGAGGGLKILLSDPEYDDNDIFLDLKVRYLNGSEAEYLTKDDVEVTRSTGNVKYYPRKSKTDMVTFSIGVEVRL